MVFAKAESLKLAPQLWILFWMFFSKHEKYKRISRFSVVSADFNEKTQASKINILKHGIVKRLPRKFQI